jgi:hypothetical protein
MAGIASEVLIARLADREWTPVRAELMSAVDADRPACD